MLCVNFAWSGKFESLKQRKKLNIYTKNKKGPKRLNNMSQSKPLKRLKPFGEHDHDIFIVYDALN